MSSASGLSASDRRGEPQSDRWTSLLHLMENEQLYLKPELTQQDVAARLWVSCRTLSRLLHDRSSKNFNGFINNYRVAEARRLLRDPAYRNLTIDAIGTRSGFNSRGVFYRMFKEVVGMSPARYRGKCQE